MKSYRIEIRRVRPGAGWYWRIVAKNGRVVAHSETYATRSNATRGAWTFGSGWISHVELPKED